MVRLAIRPPARRLPGYNRRVRIAVFIATLSISAAGVGQTAAPGDKEKPQVRMNVINVCALTEVDARIMTVALNSIPPRPVFVADFEVARGVTTLSEGRSRWVRLRREFSSPSPFFTAQYSVSTDDKGVVETLVLRPRDTKTIVQLSIEDVVTAGNPEQVLSGQTPATRVRVERPAGASVVLARCQDADQSAAEALFAAATQALVTYRAAFKASTMVVAELARPDLRAATESKPAKKRPH